MACACPLALQFGKRAQCVWWRCVSLHQAKLQQRLKRTLRCLLPPCLPLASSSSCVSVCVCVSVSVQAHLLCSLWFASLWFVLASKARQSKARQARQSISPNQTSKPEGRGKKTKRTAGHLTRPFFSHRLGAGGFPFQESQARAMVATASLCAATLMARSTPASLAPSTAAPCAALTVGRTSSTLNTCAVKKKVAGRKGEGRGKEGGRES